MVDQHTLNAYISIEKTDETILRYIEEIMQPSIQNYQGVVQKVPIIYNGAQRWVQVRKRKYLVDENGNTLYPLISFSRTSTKKRDNKIVNKVWTFRGYRNYVQVENKFSKDRPYSSFDNNIKRTSYFNLMLPIPVVCNYQFQIYADSQQHMNLLLEAFFLHDRRWWIIEGYKVKVDIGDFTNSTEIEVDNERIIRSTFSITTQSTLFPKQHQPVQEIQEITPEEFQSEIQTQQ